MMNFFGRKNRVHLKDSSKRESGRFRPLRLEPLEERALLSLSSLVIGEVTYSAAALAQDIAGPDFSWDYSEQKLTLGSGTESYIDGVIKATFDSTQVGSLDAYTMTLDLGASTMKHVINVNLEDEGLYLTNGKLILTGAGTLSVYGGIFVAGNALSSPLTKNIDASALTGTLSYGDTAITHFCDTYADLQTTINNATTGTSRVILVTNDLIRLPSSTAILVKGGTEITLLSSGNWTFSSQSAGGISKTTYNDSKGAYISVANTGTSSVDKTAVLNLGTATHFGSATLTFDGLYSVMISGERYDNYRRSTTSLIHNNGTLNMYDGFVLTNNYNNNSSTDHLFDNAGGVYVGGKNIGTSSAANMLTVDADGNPVSTDGRSVFNMCGGTISKNYSRRGTGVLVYGIFYQSGGSIEYNQTFAGVASEAAGICSRGYVFISGGSVSYNTCLSTHADGGKGGAIHNSNGAYLKISGGTISYNKANRGGGIYAGGNGYSTVIISGGEIVYNHATGKWVTDTNTKVAAFQDGGGIWANSTVELYGGTIAYNTTDENNGNGMYIKAADVSTGPNYKDPLIKIGDAGSISTTNQVYIGSLYQEKSTTKDPLVPIRVVSELTTPGLVMLVRGIASQVWEGLPLIEYAAGLTVLSNKFTLDNNVFELSPTTQTWTVASGGTHGSLPTDVVYAQTLVFKLVSSNTDFQVRIGDMFFNTTDEALYWVSTYYANASATPVVGTNITQYMYDLRANGAGVGFSDDNPLEIYLVHNAILSTGGTIGIHNNFHVRLLSETVATKAAMTTARSDTVAGNYSYWTSADGVTALGANTAGNTAFAWDALGDYAIAFYKEILLPKDAVAYMTVKAGSSLIFGDGTNRIVMNGNYQFANDAAMFCVEGTAGAVGNLVISANAVAKNNRNQYEGADSVARSAGGIVVRGYGTVTIQGTLEGNAGSLAGGVALLSENATLTIDGGTIQENEGGFVDIEGHITEYTFVGGIFNGSGGVKADDHVVFTLNNGGTKIFIESASSVVVGGTFTGIDGDSYYILSGNATDGYVFATADTPATPVGTGAIIAGHGDVTMPVTHEVQNSTEASEGFIAGAHVTWFYKDDGTYLGSFRGEVKAGQTYKFYDYTGSTPQYIICTIGTVTGDMATFTYVGETITSVTGIGYSESYGIKYALWNQGGTITIDNNGKILNNRGVYGGIYNYGTVDFNSGEISGNSNPHALLKVSGDTFVADLTKTTYNSTAATITMEIDGASLMYDAEGNAFPIINPKDAGVQKNVELVATFSNGKTAKATGYIYSYGTAGGSFLTLVGVSECGLLDMDVITSASFTLKKTLDFDKTKDHSETSSDHWIFDGETDANTTFSTTKLSNTGGADTRDLYTFTIRSVNPYTLLNNYTNGKAVYTRYKDIQIPVYGTPDATSGDGADQYTSCYYDMSGEFTVGTKTYWFHDADLTYVWDESDGTGTLTFLVLDKDMDSDFNLTGSFCIESMHALKTSDLVENCAVWQEGVFNVGAGAVIGSDNGFYLNDGHVITVTASRTDWSTSDWTIDSASMEPGTTLIVVNTDPDPDAEDTPEEIATDMMTADVALHSRTEYVVQQGTAVDELTNEIIISAARITYSANYSANPETTPETFTPSDIYVGNQQVSVLTYDETHLTVRTVGDVQYQFIGWNTEIYGTGTWYLPSDSAQNTITVLSASTVLYAQWTKNIVNTLDDDIDMSDTFRSLREAIIISQYSTVAEDHYIVYNGDFTKWEQYATSVTDISGNISGKEWSWQFTEDMVVLLQGTALSTNSAADINTVMNAYMGTTGVVYAAADMTALTADVSIDAAELVSAPIQGTGLSASAGTIFTNSKGRVIGWVDSATVATGTITFTNTLDEYYVEIVGTSYTLWDSTQTTQLSTGTMESFNTASTLFFYAADTNQTAPIARIDGTVTSGQTVTIGKSTCAVTVDSGTSAISFTSTNTIHRSFTIDANEDSRHLAINAPNKTVTLASLTFANGKATNGGAIIIGAGTADILSCTFIDNVTTSTDASSGGSGGSIANLAGTLRISSLDPNNAEQKTVFTNTGGANSTTVNAKNGGAIFSQSACTIDSAKFEGFNVSKSGGAIYNGSRTVGLGTMTISRTQILSNDAGYYGGGVVNYGTLTITNYSTISKNTALMNGGGICNGYYVTGGAQSSLTINGYVTVSYNHARGTAQVDENEPTGFGGGLQNSSIAVLSGFFFIGNTSAFSGGGIANSKGGHSDESANTVGSLTTKDDALGVYNVIQGNSTTNFGGGLASWGNLDLGGHTTFSENNAAYGKDFYIYEDMGASRQIDIRPDVSYDPKNIMRKTVTATVSAAQGMTFADASFAGDTVLYIDRTGNGNYESLGEIGSLTTSSLGLDAGQYALDAKFVTADGIESEATTLCLTVTVKIALADNCSAGYYDDLYLSVDSADESLRYFWDIDDDGVYEEHAPGFYISASSLNFHGKYAVIRLKAINAEGIEAASDTASVALRSFVPTVSFEYAEQLDGQVLFLTAETNADFIASWTVSWGDGTESQMDSVSRKIAAVHYFVPTETDQRYQVTLRFDDRDGVVYEYALAEHFVAGTGAAVSSSPARIAETIEPSAVSSNASAQISPDALSVAFTLEAPNALFVPTLLSRSDEMVNLPNRAMGQPLAASLALDESALALILEADGGDSLLAEESWFENISFDDDPLFEPPDEEYDASLATVLAHEERSL